jgi:hypothetical protein
VLNPPNPTSKKPKSKRLCAHCLEHRLSPIPPPANIPNIHHISSDKPFTSVTSSVLVVTLLSPPMSWSFHHPTCKSLCHARGHKRSKVSTSIPYHRLTTLRNANLSASTPRGLFDHSKSNATPGSIQFNSIQFLRGFLTTQELISRPIYGERYPDPSTVRQDTIRYYLHAQLCPKRQLFSIRFRRSGGQLTDWGLTAPLEDNRHTSEIIHHIL